MLQLNIKKFSKLQGEMTDVDMAKKLNMSRTQLWRIKNKKTSVGQKFIASFMTAYPQERIEDYFLTKGVTFQEREVGSEK